MSGDGAARRRSQSANVERGFGAIAFDVCFGIVAPSGTFYWVASTSFKLRPNLIDTAVLSFPAIALLLWLALGEFCPRPGLIAGLLRLTSVACGGLFCASLVLFFAIPWLSLLLLLMYCVCYGRNGDLARDLARARAARGF